MNKLKTALAFSKNILTTGALFQTSSKVEEAISSKISDKPNMIYIEFGMGHGNITQVILDKMNPSSKLYSFEINEEFCDTVRASITDERLSIVNKGAEELNNVVEGQVDGIVSSIPFTLFTKEKTDSILKLSYDKLKSNCFFSQVQYSKVMKKKFAAAFDRFELNHVSKLPPEFIYHCFKN